eukprot:13540404-Alexandrium_andersonii.AAC.1
MPQSRATGLWLWARAIWVSCPLSQMQEPEHEFGNAHGHKHEPRADPPLHMLSVRQTSGRNVRARLLQ